MDDIFKELQWRSCSRTNRPSLDLSAKDVQLSQAKSLCSASSEISKKKRDIEQINKKYVGFKKQLSSRGVPSMSSVSTNQVKFSASVIMTHEEQIEESGEKYQLSTDDTVRLFQCCPLTSDHRINFRRELDTICKNYHRLLRELEVTNYKTRALAVLDNINRLQSDILSMEKILRDHQYKVTQNENIILASMTARLEAEKRLISLKLQVQQLEAIRIKYKRAMEKYTPLQNFIERVLPLTPFKSFGDVINRHTSLLTYRGTIASKRDDLKAIRKKNDDKIKKRESEIYHLKEKLNNLKDTHSQLVKSNKQVESTFNWDGLIESETQTVLMVQGIQNMYNLLMNYRTFTQERLQDAEGIYEKIDAIGNIVLDYSEIMAEPKLEETNHRRQRPRRGYQHKRMPL